MESQGDQITDNNRDANTEILNMLNIFRLSPGLATIAQDAPGSSQMLKDEYRIDTEH